jgi:hypothetical protein
MQVQNASLTLGVLHLEPQMMKKSDKWGLESVYLLFVVSSFNKTRAKLLSPNFAQFLGFWNPKN